MHRFATYFTMTVLGLACFACDSPMEVAANASAHTAEDTSSSTEPKGAGTAGSTPERSSVYPVSTDPSLAQSSDEAHVEAETGDDGEPLRGKLNLNTANTSKLKMLPGIGPATANRIESYRTKRRFEEIDDIKRIQGIGDKTFADLEPYLAVSGETTLASSE